MTSYCMKNQWELRNVQVACYNNGDPLDASATSTAAVCRTGDTLLLLGELTVHKGWPSGGYALQVQLCKQSWAFANAWTCAYQHDYSTVNVCTLANITVQPDQDQSSYVSCGTRGSFTFDLEVPFPGQVDFTNFNGSPVFVQASMYYGYSTYGGLYEKCLVEFATTTPYYSSSVSNHVTYAAVSLGVVATLMGAWAWRRRRQRVVLQNNTTGLSSALTEQGTKGKAATGTKAFQKSPHAALFAFLELTDQVVV
ncbi:hypothetical protein ACA910_004000 [Epithemia clementina (nom. ined.)]